MPESQAQVLVEELDGALSTAIARETASKADVVELRAAIHGLEERFDQRLEQVDRRLDELRVELRHFRGATLRHGARLITFDGDRVDIE